MGSSTSTASDKATLNGSEVKVAPPRRYNSLSSVDQPSAHYDICLVFEADPTTKRFKADGEELFNNVCKLFGNENVYAFCGEKNEDKIFVLVYGSNHRIEMYADLRAIPVLCDPAKLHGAPGNTVLSLNETQTSELDPYAHIYVAYRTDKRVNEMYDRSNSTGTPFSNATRIRIMESMLTEPLKLGGLGVALREKEQKHPSLLAVYPLQEDTTELASKWLNFCTAILPWRQPFDDLKDYFGAQIALYYKFLGHFSTWLLFPGGFGLIVAIEHIVNKHIGGPLLPVFCVFICLWATLMMENWKRKEANTALEWGMTEFEETEAVRPEFKYEKKVTVLGETKLFFDPSTRRNFVIKSFTAIAFLCACVVSSTAAVYALRYQLYHTKLRVFGSIIASFLNSGQMTIFSILYAKVAKALTDYENHETDTEYTDSMIAKNFLFEFINNYASFIFIAFIASSLPNPGVEETLGQKGQCGADNCMAPLALNLGIVFIMRIFFYNFLDFVIMPQIYKFNLQKFCCFCCECHNRAEELAKLDLLAPAEREYELDPYDNVVDVIAEYLSVAINFGFMTLFVSALPITPLLALIGSAVERRLDAHKMLHNIRRPFPEGTEDIGTWQSVFEIITNAAVISNAIIMVFTAESFGSLDISSQFWIFVVVQWILFMIIYFLRMFVEDVPASVRTQIERMKYINGKVMQEIPGVTLEEWRRLTVQNVKLTDNFAKTMTIHKSEGL